MTTELLYPDLPAAFVTRMQDLLKEEYDTFIDSYQDKRILVSADGYSIGWGKASAGTLKNHYPKGLRIAAKNISYHQEPLP